MSEILSFPKPNVDQELAETIKEMESIYRAYVTFSDPSHSFICSLWCAHTYLFRPPECRGLPATGYLAFYSPESDCGKSTALKLTSWFSRGDQSVLLGSSAAGVFRNIDTKDKERYTFVMDELDKVHPDPVFIATMNGGYTPKGKVVRQGGPDYTKKLEYSTFCPKAFGYIRNVEALKIMEEPLERRCIRIHMRRRTKSEEELAPVWLDNIMQNKIGTVLDEPGEKWPKGSIPWRLMQWEIQRCQDLTPLFAREDPRTGLMRKGNLWVKGFTGREYQIWCGVLAIASLVGRLDEAKEAALNLAEINRTEFEAHDRRDLEILEAIRENLPAMCDELGFKSEVAYEILIRQKDVDYMEPVKSGKTPYLSSPKRLSNILRGYGAHSKKTGPDRYRRIPKEVVEEVLVRYLGDET